MPDRFLSRWRGILLSVVGIVFIIWLAATGQLGLYIHPRYYVFTTVMAVIGAVFVLAAFAVIPASTASHDDADRKAEDEPVRRRGPVGWMLVSALLVAAAAAALLVLPPSTLTTSTVEQRDINGSASLSASADSSGLSGSSGSSDSSGALELTAGDYSSFTVKDWAGLLRQGADEDFLAGKDPTLIGFVTPDTDDPENVFYVARFVVTCCAVDATPIGVPVYSPGWQEEYSVDDWVSITGTFAANPSIDSMQAIAIIPTEIVPTAQPAEPYVY